MRVLLRASLPSAGAVPPALLTTAFAQLYCEPHAEQILSGEAQADAAPAAASTSGGSSAASSGAASGRGRGGGRGEGRGGGRGAGRGGRGAPAGLAAMLAAGPPAAARGGRGGKWAPVQGASVQATHKYMSVDAGASVFENNNIIIYRKLKTIPQSKSITKGPVLACWHTWQR